MSVGTAPDVATVGPDVDAAPLTPAGKGSPAVADEGQAFAEVLSSQPMYDRDDSARTAHGTAGSTARGRPAGEPARSQDRAGGSATATATSHVEAKPSPVRPRVGLAQLPTAHVVPSQGLPGAGEAVASVVSGPADTDVPTAADRSISAVTPKVGATAAGPATSPAAGPATGPANGLAPTVGTASATAGLAASDRGPSTASRNAAPLAPAGRSAGLDDPVATSSPAVTGSVDSAPAPDAAPVVAAHKPGGPPATVTTSGHERPVQPSPVGTLPTVSTGNTSDRGEPPGDPASPPGGRAGSGPAAGSMSSGPPVSRGDAPSPPVAPGPVADPVSPTGQPSVAQGRPPVPVDAVTAVTTADSPTAGLAAQQVADTATPTPQRGRPSVTGTPRSQTDAIAGDPVAPTAAVGAAAGPAASTEAVGAADADALDVSGLAASISRPLAEGNGEYSVSVSLHPPQLGEVRALLSLRGDMLEVTLTPEAAAGHEALDRALPALREQLSTDGLQVSVSLGDPRGEGDQRGPAAGNGTVHDPGSGPPTPVPTTDRSTRSPVGNGRIHLVL